MQSFRNLITNNLYNLLCTTIDFQDLASILRVLPWTPVVIHLISQLMSQMFPSLIVNKDQIPIKGPRKKVISLKRLKHSFHSFKISWVRMMHDQIKSLANWLIYEMDLMEFLKKLKIN